MAKTKISEFSATPANNTDIDGINIAEGCAPSGINDAIRELMAQLKDWQSGTSNDPYVIGSSGSLTLNQGTANGVAYLNGSKVLTTGSALTFDGTRLNVGNSDTTVLGVRGLTRGVRFDFDSTQATIYAVDNAYFNSYQPLRIGGSDTRFTTSGTEQMRLTSTGLGIGTSSPHASAKLHVYAAGDYTDENAPFTLGNSGAGGVRLYAGVNNTNDYSYIGSVKSGTRYNNLVLQPNGGNLGLGVTPSAWGSGNKAIQINGGAAYSSGADYGITANVYVDSGGTSRYMQSFAFGSKYYQYNGQHQWHTTSSTQGAGNAITFTQAMTLDASGNLGIGTSSPSDTLSYGKALDIQGTLGSALYARSATNSSTVYGVFAYDTNAVRVNIGAIGTNNYLRFVTAVGEAARIDSSGNLLVGKTTTSLSTDGHWFAPLGYSYHTIAAGANTLHVYSSTASAYRFYVTAAGVINATTTTITAISDQRLKENIRDLDDGLEKVMALQPRKFDWKEGKGEDTKNARGFIAQELELVFPDMVTEWIDPAPEGEEPYKAVNANLIPTLVKAIQEQQAIITALTARVAALESN